MGGWPVAHATQAAGVSRQTAYRWLERFRKEGGAGLRDRSSRPHRSPSQVPAEIEKRIVADRVTEKEGPHLMAWRLDIPRSTIYRVPSRRGLSRLSDLDRTSGVPIRYVRDCPGELVHVDIKKLGRIPDGGGWRVLGREASESRQRVGYEYVHSMVDEVVVGQLQLRSAVLVIERNSGPVGDGIPKVVNRHVIAEHPPGLLTWTRPDESQCVVGDATWIPVSDSHGKGPNKRYFSVGDLGKISRPVVGRELVVLLCRGSRDNERIILDADFGEGGVRRRGCERYRPQRR